MKDVFSIEIKEEKMGSAGVNWGNTDFEGGEAEWAFSVVLDR